MRVGHLVSSYLHVTENWIHAQMTAGDSCVPFVMNRGERVNAGIFPARHALHLSELSRGDCLLEADGWEHEGHSRAFADACRQSRVQVLHAHFGPEGVLGVPLAASLGVPLVTSFYGYDATVLPRDPAWRRAIRGLFEFGTLFLAEGPALAQTLVRLGCPPSRVRLTPLPVRIPPRAARPAADQPATVLVCGRLVEKKGVDASLRVLARLREITERPFQAVVIGDGPERVALAALHQRLRLGDQVSFAGSVDQHEFDQYLLSATVVLQMSRTAADGDAEGGAPVVVSQALACGVPVVSTRHCDIPWIVQHERTGFIVDSDDVDGAARWLAQLIEQLPVRRTLARAARRSARRRLSAVVSGLLLEQHYAAAIALGAVPRAAERLALHAPLRDGILLDFRRRAGDVDGISRLASRRALDAETRARALRVLGQAHEVRGDHVAAASAFRRWRRLAPREPDAWLEEARAWLRSARPAKAIGPLVGFVRAHPNRSYALAQAMDACATTDAARIVSLTRAARRHLMRVGTPAERLAFDVACLERGAARHPPGGSRRGLRQAWDRYWRTPSVAEADPSQVEAALVAAYVFAVRVGDEVTASTLEWLRQEGSVREPLLRYRMASALERQGGALTEWARTTFRQLERSRRLPPDTRAGAGIHLATIEQLRRSLA
ncbi:MAG: hypothetical protein A3G25_11460 [Betaproteobacteria bacterium RIFCSPLOWO2_12_FULL_63_13]|nr:MAG: hypothetical protein A3G25_11460 [Betaproteobacteria bacterium RIFCSPLOWO2_12_FULL_63_13]